MSSMYKIWVLNKDRNEYDNHDPMIAVDNDMKKINSWCFQSFEVYKREVNVYYKLHFCVKRERAEVHFE